MQQSPGAQCTGEQNHILSASRRRCFGSPQHYHQIKDSMIIKHLREYVNLAIKKRHPWSSLVLNTVLKNYDLFSKDEIYTEMKRFKQIFKGLMFKKFWKRLSSEKYCEFGLKWGERYDRLSLIYFIRIYLNLVQDFLGSKKDLQELDLVKINVKQIWIIFGNDDEMFFNYLLKRMELEKDPAIKELQSLKGTTVFKQMNHFFRITGYDVSLMIDLIMSEETEFLEFFLKYLIKALKESDEFLLENCKQIEDIEEMFRGICRGLQTLQHIIVFNTEPLRKRIMMVLDMIEFYHKDQFNPKFKNQGEEIKIHAN
jgi:hypothetical protein